MNDHLLVIDIGTQSLRTSIVNKKGEILHFEKEIYEEPYVSPQTGFAEQRIDYYIERLCATTKRIRETDPELFDTVSGMVIDDFRDSSIILDKDKKPIRNAILWLDQRVTQLNGKNFRLYERILFNLIGMGDTVKYNAERTATWWLMENEPENWKKMAYYAPVGAYFNKEVTGNLVVSSADCIGHYPVDFKHGKWFPSIHPKINVFGIPMKALVPLQKVGTVLGYVTEEFSKKSGIPQGIPLYASGSDKACETLGNGCTNKTQASISLGTACSIDVVDSKYSEPETFLPSYQAPYPGAYDLEVQIYRGLWMVRWFGEQFGQLDKMESEKEGIRLEEYLDKKIENIPTGSDGLVLQPYWGPGLKRPNGKGAVVGFSATHTRYHFYKAILEGICFALREGLDEIVRKTHRVPDYIVVSGGGSGAKVLLQMIADVFNIEVHQSSEKESATLGAAISGFLANGTYKTPEEAVKNMVKPGIVFKPNIKNAKIYDRIYKKVYLKMYPSLAKIDKDIKDFCVESRKKVA